VHGGEGVLSHIATDVEAGEGVEWLNPARVVGASRFERVVGARDAIGAFGLDALLGPTSDRVVA